MMAKRAAVPETRGSFLTRVCCGTGYLQLHVTGGKELDLTHGWQTGIRQVLYIYIYVHIPTKKRETVPIGGKAYWLSQAARSHRSRKGADVQH